MGPRAGCSARVCVEPSVQMHVVPAVQMPGLSTHGAFHGKGLARGKSTRGTVVYGVGQFQTMQPHFVEGPLHHGAKRSPSNPLPTGFGHQ